MKIKTAIELSSIFELGILYILIFLPFFFGGLIVSIILATFSENVSKLYFFDLVGASLGTLAVIGLLRYFGGPNGLIFISLLGIVTAVVLSSYFGFKKISVVSILLSIFIFSLLLIGIILNPFTLEFTKGAADTAGREIKEFSAWNAISRVDLFDKGNEKYILIDSDAFTKVVKDTKETREELHSDLGSIAFHINQKPNVLIIGAGGGVDVLRALSFNSKVTGVEINDIIVNDLMKSRLRDFSGNLYFRDNVDIVVEEGRNYIKRSKEKYDVIQMSLIDTWAATAAGAFTLTENNLYTVEAFKDYLNQLTDNGVFTTTRWEFAKPQETIRLIAIALESLDQLGVKDPEKNIFVVKQDVVVPEAQRTRFEAVANVMVKKSAFTKREADNLKKIAESREFVVLYNPYGVQENVYDELIRSKNRGKFYKEYLLDISPTTDDRPFFFYTLKLKDTLNFNKLFSGGYEKEISLKTNLGLFLLTISLFLTLGLAFLFILIPLIVKKYRDLVGNSLNKLIILAYFAGLGLGFISIEIVLMQKFILFLGHPVYALSVILFSLLVFSGIGSYTTKFVKHEKIKKNIVLNLLVLFFITVTYLYLLSTIFDKYIGLMLVPRIIISILLLAPIGLVLGRFLPLGIKLIDKRYHAMIPWVWGINGTVSVVGSVTALILAINFGFNITLIIGNIFYLLTLGLIFKQI